MSEQKSVQAQICDDVTTTSRRRRHNDHVDAGYAWVIVVCSFVLQVSDRSVFSRRSIDPSLLIGLQGVSCGISFSVGVFFVEWLDVFGQPHDVTAWVGSLNTGLMFACGEWWVTKLRSLLRT